MTKLLGEKAKYYLPRSDTLIGYLYTTMTGKIPGWWVGKQHYPYDHIARNVFAVLDELREKVKEDLA